MEEKKLCSETNETCELVLDGGFVVPKDISKNDGCVTQEIAASNDAFIAPEINSFGQSFRSLYIFSVCSHSYVASRVWFLVVKHWSLA